ncbi:MAG: PadR family transcriptional regulator [Deltaproteobacteria bacterium]|nr:PadR family transcriptional regulator [Deltaproteobacteria bacterium]MBW2371973.1 PadR family transcriptional regulator [Deltaproteobacteria bacterium]
MSLRHAILGILDYREMHGYQLKRVLDEGISTFWPVNLAAIYPSLRKLEEEGLVQGRREPSAEGRPDRKVYTITNAGCEELALWRRVAPDGVPSVRNPLYLKLLFAHEEDFGEALSWLDKQADRAQAGLDQLRAEQANPRAFSTFFVEFLRESGVQHLELEIELLKELRARMQERVSRGQRAGKD